MPNCGVSRSTIFPLPSSPHWAPSTARFIGVTILLDSTRVVFINARALLRHKVVARSREKTRGAILKWRRTPESSEKNFCFRLTRSRSFFKVYLSPVIPTRSALEARNANASLRRLRAASPRYSMRRRHASRSSSAGAAVDRTTLLHHLRDRLGRTIVQHIDVERTATTPERFLRAITVASPFPPESPRRSARALRSTRRSPFRRARAGGKRAGHVSAG